MNQLPNSLPNPLPALPSEFRKLVSSGAYREQTSGVCPGYAQTNLVVLPSRYAYDFLLYSQRNPYAIPLLEVTDTGGWRLSIIADADVRSDYPMYRIYINGGLDAETPDISRLWRSDFVSFHIGCSFSFESALIEAGIPVRNIEEKKNVPMFDTNIPCRPAGIFSGNMVVSMRPIPYALVPRAVSITGQMPRVHGAPIHIGDPSLIGINDINKPDYGEAVTINPGEVPVFWPCGVTPQNALRNARPEICITHSPGHMLVTDITNASLRM